MSRHAWIITADYLAEPGEESAVGVTGPDDAPQLLVRRLERGEGIRWETLDDDGEAYYSGRVIIPEDAAEGEMNSPLRDYAVGVGCVVLRYQDNGAWREIEC